VKETSAKNRSEKHPVATVGGLNRGDGGKKASSKTPQERFGFVDLGTWRKRGGRLKERRSHSTNCEAPPQEKGCSRGLSTTTKSVTLGEKTEHRADKKGYVARLQKGR